MLRQLIPQPLTLLALAAALLAPLAAPAQTPPATPPAAPAAPVAPAAPAARNANRVNGRITAVDATATPKTVTVTVRRKPTTLSVTDSTKIYKADDAKKTPTGAFADLTVGTRITATTNGDETAPTAKEIHIRAARTAAPAAPAAPSAPATPAPPAAPATP